MTVAQSNKKDLLTWFDSCKSISAKDAADRIGIPLKQHGNRHVAKCFLHDDKTASMTFYDDGRFYCFSCKASGDAVELYKLYYNLDPSSAAKQLLADFGLSEPAPGAPIARTKQPTAKDLQDSVEMVRERKVDELLIIKRKAEDQLILIEKKPVLNDAEQDKLYKLVATISAAKELIARLDMLQPTDLIEWVSEGASIDDL